MEKYNGEYTEKGDFKRGTSGLVALWGSLWERRLRQQKMDWILGRATLRTNPFLIYEQSNENEDNMNPAR